MTDWKAIWERKGNLPTNYLCELNGYESTTANLKDIALRIASELDLQPNDKVLEIGCGAGATAQYISPHLPLHWHRLIN